MIFLGILIFVAAEHPWSVLSMLFDVDLVNNRTMLKLTIMTMIYNYRGFNSGFAHFMTSICFDRLFSVSFSHLHVGQTKITTTLSHLNHSWSMILLQQVNISNGLMDLLQQ